MCYLFFRRLFLCLSSAVACLLVILLIIRVNKFQAKSCVEEPDIASIVLPYEIPNTGLLLEHFVSYEGDFTESDSGAFVTDAAAIIVENQGSHMILSAKIEMEIGDQIYTFEGTYIPAKSRIMLLEKNCKTYPTEPILRIGGRTQLVESLDVSQNLLVQAEDMGRITLTNISDQSYTQLLIYHKGYIEEHNIYLGGITYTMPISSLQPGQSETVFPEHFACGYSKVLYITAGTS